MRLLFFLLFPCFCAAQIIDEEGEYGVDWGGYLWGLRGGLSIGSQDWLNIDTGPNMGFHGDLYLEGIPRNVGGLALWAQAGFHQRGSRIAGRRAFDLRGQGQVVRLPADNFLFNNAVVSVGAKQVVGAFRSGDLYYLIGLRAEYNLSTNLDEYDQLTTLGGVAFRRNYPIDSYEFINRFVYGASAGGGINIPLSPAIGGFAEVTVQPDLNFQYNQGRIDNVLDPLNPGNTSIGERAIRNVTIEFSVGLRFLRRWTYID